MKLNVFAAVLLVFSTLAVAAPDADQLYASLERRLQALKTLEIRYKAVGSSGEDVVSGRMIWVKPDRFYHDTPEWTVCQNGNEQWRYLKGQNTLILEAASEQSEFSPQNALFNLKNSFQAASIQPNGDNHRVLILKSRKPDVPGEVTIEFPSQSDTPDEMAFSDSSGTDVHYRIVRWDENVKPDTSLFTPPGVPPENLIDFRAAGKGK